MKLVKWQALFGVICFLLAGCAGENRQIAQNGDREGSLTLGGYRSVQVATVSVTPNIPYDPEKFGESVGKSFQSLINQSLNWSVGKQPRASLSIQITRFREPSSFEQLTIGIPYQIDYTITARDAESGKPLGVASGTTKKRLVGSILAEGTHTAFFHRQFEKGFSDNTRQDSILSQLVVDMERELNQARRHQPENMSAVKPEPSVAPKPALVRTERVAISKN